MESTRLTRQREILSSDIDVVVPVEKKSSEHSLCLSDTGIVE